MRGHKFDKCREECHNTLKNKEKDDNYVRKKD